MLLLSGYGTSGALHDPTPFGPYAPPPYASEILYSSTMAESAQDAEHLHYVGSPEFSAQHPIEEPGVAMVDPRFREFPHITSRSPLQGPSGSTMCIEMQSPHELRASPPRLTFYLLFASKRVECALQLHGDASAFPKQYVVSAKVPPFMSTGWHAFDVPLRVTMESSNANIPIVGVDLGLFHFTGQIMPPDSSRKRRLSSESAEIVPRPSKQQSTQQMHNEPASENAIYSTSPYSPFASTPVTTLPSTTNGHASPPRQSGHRYSASVASASSVKAQSPQTPPAWSPSFTPVNQVHATSRLSTTPVQASDGDAAGKTPALIRTSTIQQSAASLSTVAASQSFNPYAMYPSKAVLKLNGDLDSMADDWSLEEWDARRRLVQFSRRQNGSTIHADFKAIAPEDRQPNSICISCIWWAEKREPYVTSVDTIFLLESLVAVRFTVEEKNRIRRNLEGFRPLTVSKSKADSEEFFKVIMGFPSPKPRNIEKDVKVFPWKILAHALKKIIGKYSASYSSTACALPTPLGSQYASNGASDSGTDGRPSASPQLGTMNHDASPYPLSTASFSPHLSQQRVSVPISSGPPMDLRLQVPTVIPGYSFPATHPHHPVPHCSPALRGSPQPMTAPPAAGRMMGSWDGADYSSFEAGAAGPQAHMDTYNYHRLVSSMPTTQGYIPATASYSIPQSGI